MSFKNLEIQILHYVPPHFILQTLSRTPRGKKLEKGWSIHERVDKIKTEMNVTQPFDKGSPLFDIVAPLLLPLSSVIFLLLQLFSLFS